MRALYNHNRGYIPRKAFAPRKRGIPGSASDHLFLKVRNHTPSVVALPLFCTSAPRENSYPKGGALRPSRTYPSRQSTAGIPLGAFPCHREWTAETRAASTYRTVCKLLSPMNCPHSTCGSRFPSIQFFLCNRTELAKGLGQGCSRPQQYAFSDDVELASRGVPSTARKYCAPNPRALSQGSFSSYGATMTSGAP